MAMEVETRILDPLKPNHMAFKYQSPHRNPTANNAFEIKMLYVRITSSRPNKHGTIEMVFPPRPGGTRLAVNGFEICPEIVAAVALNKNRVDPVLYESVHVSTNIIRVRGCYLCFEIRVEGLLPPVVVGELVRRNGVWGMQCRDGGWRGGEGVAAADVYVAGRVGVASAILLNGVVKLSNSHVFDETVVGDDSKAEEEKVIAKQDGDGQGISSSYRSSEQEEEMFNVGDGELSWFNAGVRVGMGLGLGISLVIGVGVGLIFRGYRTAAVTFRRFI